MAAVVNNEASRGEGVVGSGVVAERLRLGDLKFEVPLFVFTCFQRDSATTQPAEVDGQCRAPMSRVLPDDRVKRIYKKRANPKCKSENTLPM
jgi:hypothetical protein